MSQEVQMRIEHAEERIKYWQGHPAQQQVWIGIKVELELLQKFFWVKQ